MSKSNWQLFGICGPSNVVQNKWSYNIRNSSRDLVYLSRLCIEIHNVKCYFCLILCYLAYNRSSLEYKSARCLVSFRSHDRCSQILTMRSVRMNEINYFGDQSPAPNLSTSNMSTKNDLPLVRVPTNLTRPPKNMVMGRVVARVRVSFWFFVP